MLSIGDRLIHSLTHNIWKGVDDTYLYSVRIFCHLSSSCYLLWFRHCFVWMLFYCLFRVRYFILFFSISPMISSLILFSLAHSMHFASSKFANYFLSLDALQLPISTFIIAENYSVALNSKPIQINGFIYFLSHLKKRDSSHSIPFGIINIYSVRVHCAFGTQYVS